MRFYRESPKENAWKEIGKENKMDDLYVTRETLIGEVVNEYPEAIDVLFSIGMHCLGCPASQMESLEEACAVHGFDPSAVVKEINKKIAEARA